MIVITGGAGFIGSAIVARLDARGTDGLAIVDRLGRDDKWRNLQKRDLLAIIAPEDLFAYLETHRSMIGAVIHMGAISSTTETDVDLVIRTNLTLSQDLWRWCADHRVRFIYASSAATYGDGAQGFSDEQTSLHLARLRPLNPYGWSKHLFDRWAVRQAERGYPCPPQWVGLKFFNVYGPNEYHKAGQQSVVAHLYRQIAAGQSAQLFKSYHPDYADGGQVRDFLWVGDLVQTVMWFVDHPEHSGLFNLGTGRARSFLDLAHAVFDALGRPPDIRFIDMPETLRPKYQYFTEADTHRLTAIGAPLPTTSLEDGVRSYVLDFLTADDPYL